MLTLVNPSSRNAEPACPAPSDQSLYIVNAPHAAQSDTGLLALAWVAGLYRVAADAAGMHHVLGLGQECASSEHLVRAARQLGLKAALFTRQPVTKALSVPLPAIIRLKDGSFAILAARLEADRFGLLHPLTRKQSVVTAENLAEVWTGDIIKVARRIGGVGSDPQSFNLKWFVPSLWRYRKPLSNVLVASLVLQLFALVTPLLFQLVIDKVLVHKGVSTLLVVISGLVALGLFDVVLQYLRAYILTHTTSRIDVELGARLFDHLLRLPLAYFETRATGQTVARVRELETIRTFLTGQGLSSALDALFVLVFIFVLALYSIKLTLIVAASIPLYLLIAFAIRPALRERIKERFNRGAASQQFLVESILGMQTMKAAAVEPLLRNDWEDKLAAYVRTSFKAVTLAAIGQGAIQYVSKATTAFVLLFGALAVMNGEMTVGALIAFNMMMNQVTGPILRLSQLWQDFQQVNVSVDRLGDIFNARPEPYFAGKTAPGPAKGSIAFKNVHFRYRPDATQVLQGINLEIPAGQVIGIVGPSGSGKSTLTKLVQGLYRPERGQILVDGIDIGQVDTAWLRRQIGVVLQENVLFNRSIHDNIALADPGMPRGLVIAAAELAGAHEFISQLSNGYDTTIEERGANLSGGQRQRIAIARALITRPRILIFDEATSALDYESERIIQSNMKTIVKNRTVFVIAHRLAAVRHCDRIITVDRGQIIEDGSHKELLSANDGAYARLWRMQSEHQGA